MNITKWNIWHCYSSSVVGNMPSLTEWAKAVVGMDVGALAVKREGECWYKADEEVREAYCGTSFLPNRAEGAFVLPPRMPPYAKECLVQAIAMRTHEQHVLADPLSRVPSYLRIYFEECVLEFEDLVVTLYPQAKLYEDGVLLIEFRVLAGENPYSLDDFVEQQLNLYAHMAQGGEIPLPILLGAASHGFSFGKRRLRSTLERFRRKTRAELAKLEEERDSGDFSWRRLRLDNVWGALAAMELAPYNLRVLANLYAWSLLDAASTVDHRRRGRRRLGGYWSGRPSVYIAGTDPPVSEADELIRGHTDSLAKILARSSTPPSGDAGGIIGPNLRVFGDYALFVNRGVTLWFGLDDALFKQPTATGAVCVDQAANLGGFVSTKQVQVEFLEYWYISHKALEEKSLEPSKSLADLARVEREVAALDRQVQEIPPSGEVADFLRRAGECLDVEGIRQIVRANLRYKEVVLQEKRDRRNNWFGAALAVILASSGAPAIGEAFVEPAWKLACWPRPLEDSLWDLLSGGIAFAVLLLLALLAACAIHGVRRRV